MLSPGQIESAGDAVAAVYNDIEARMLDHLVGALLEIDRLDQKTATELALLTQTHGPALEKIIEESAGEIAEEVRETAERLLEASDSDDLERLGGGEPIWPQQIAATVAGVAEVLERL